MKKIFVVFDTEDQTLSLRIPSVTIRAGTKGMYWAKIFFDTAWQNMQNIKAGFFRNNDFHPVSLTAEADGAYICEIPPPVIANAGQFSIGMFAGCQLITNTEFVPVLPSFKNEVFNNADFLDWFEETDKLISILRDAIAGKSPLDHHHNDKYFTETETMDILKSYVTSTVLQQVLDTHDTNIEAHSDLRLLIENVTDRLNAVLDSDDITLDQLSEIVAYIKSNKSLIDAITTSKANANHVHDDRYIKKTDAEQLANSVSRVPVTVTETINGTQSSFTCDYSFDQIKSCTGVPYVRYLVDVGAGANLVCEAALYAREADRIVFASAQDAFGVSYHFVIDADGCSVSSFSSKKHFSAVPFISDEDGDDEIPNVFAVRNYTQSKNLILDAVINYAEALITLYSPVAAEKFEAAYEAGKNVYIRATFADEDMQGITLNIPLTAVKTSYLCFSTVTDLSQYASGSCFMIAVPVIRKNLSAYGILIEPIKFS